ncbi:MAG: hypothetical protein HY831_01460 [Candidatus Aenigmarchaeota archaeon]|nr:hypothetical protein [Candidatus Aenigmarchaeota archaeon]
MNKKWKLIDKILSGKKTIESRWYISKRAPWNRIKRGDIVYFKDSSCPVTAMAYVEDVKQVSDLDSDKIKLIVGEYGGEGKICLTNIENSIKWVSGKRYCVLIFLKDPRKVKPFNIDKKGFGNACAWICVNDVRTLIS